VGGHLQCTDTAWFSGGASGTMSGAAVAGRGCRLGDGGQVTQWTQYDMKLECGLSLYSVMHIHVWLYIML
jgi:hypothetical protein